LRISWQKRFKKIGNLFVACVRSKSKTNVKVGSIINEHGQFISDAQEKAELLNDFFWSVLTKEDISGVPVPDQCFDEEQDCRLLHTATDPETTAAKLWNLKPAKAAGDDNMPP